MTLLDAINNVSARIIVVHWNYEYSIHLLLEMFEDTK